jgi:hypothetical protein
MRGKWGSLMARWFVSAVGAAYLLLAAWCAVSPAQTSAAVGFVLQPGAGQSEFLTVYGGLEFALGTVFLWPLLRPSDIRFPLFLCWWVHGCLVMFRTAGFVMYADIPTTTYALAAVEWFIFLGSTAVGLARRPR